MSKLNTIFSNKEYIAQGFTEEEVTLIKRHDILFNKYQTIGLTEEEKEEMFSLINTLRL